MYLRNGVAGVYQRAGFRDRGDLSALDLGAQVHNCIAVFDCSEIVRADARGPVASGNSTLYVTGLNCSSVLCGYGGGPIGLARIDTCDCHVDKTEIFIVPPLETTKATDGRLAVAVMDRFDIVCPCPSRTPEKLAIGVK